MGKPLPKPKKRSVSKLKRELDTIFSRYIRHRDTNADGMIRCYTCPKVMEFKQAQAGHFVPRQYLSVRYDEVNVKSQCFACNMLYNGQPSSYAARLERDYGKGTVEMLESRRKEITPNFPYEYWIGIYKEKVGAFET